MKRGKFIVVEGGDGAGKDTQIEFLKGEFSGPDFLYTREPGGTQVGKTLREMLLHESHGELGRLTEAFLFLADRAQHAHELVRPALEKGITVISNRSWVSMIAFQIYGRDNLELKPLVDTAVEHIFRDCPIDLAIILDVPPEVGIARQKALGKKFDVMESMPMDARERIRSGFLKVAKDLPVARIIDGDRSVKEVHVDVSAAVRQICEIPCAVSV